MTTTPGRLAADALALSALTLLVGACSPPDGAGPGPSSPPPSAHAGCTPGALLWTYPLTPHISGVDFSSDGERLFLADSTAWYIDVATGATELANSLGGYHIFSPDREVSVFTDFRVLKYIGVEEIIDKGFLPHDLDVLPADSTELAWAWSGAPLVVSDASGGLRAYDPADWSILYDLPGTYPGRIYGVAISEDGETALVGGDASSAMTIDLATGDTLATYSGHLNWIWGLDLSRDGELAVTASVDRGVHTWNARTGERLGGYNTTGHFLRDVALTPSGDVYIAVGDDAFIGAYRVDGDGRLFEVQGDMQVFKVVVSPDDTVFATLEWQQDRTDAGLLRLWCLGAR